MSIYSDISAIQQKITLKIRYWTGNYTRLTNTIKTKSAVYNTVVTTHLILDILSEEIN